MKEMKRIELILSDFVEEFITCLSAVALMVAVSILTNNKITLDFVLIILISNFIVYFFDFVGDPTDQDFREKTEKKVVKTKKIFFQPLLCFLGLLILFLVLVYGNFQSLIFFVILLVLGICYPLFFKKMTKRIVGFKDIYVAVIWNLMVIFYLLYYSIDFNFGIILLLVFILIRDLLNASYCDIKDIEEDRQNGLLTFANYFGTRKFLTFFHFINLFSTLILILGFHYNLLPLISLSLIFPVILTSLLVHLWYRKGTFSTLAVDLEYFFWVIILFSIRKL